MDPQHYSVRESVEKLKIFAEFSETINYLYVIDNDKKLVGVVSYRDLIINDESEKFKILCTAGLSPYLQMKTKKR